MALVTRIKEIDIAPRVERFSNQSSSGGSITVSTLVGALRQILAVTIKYSAAASVTATVTLNSGAGAAWDTLLQNIVFSAATDGVWIPDEEFWIMDDDVLDVLCPSVTSETSSTAIYTRSY